CGSVRRPGPRPVPWTGSTDHLCTFPAATDVAGRRGRTCHGLADVRVSRTGPDRGWDRPLESGVSGTDVTRRVPVDTCCDKSTPTSARHGYRCRRRPWV